MKSKGFGDTVEKFTTATGIKKAVNAVAKATGKSCGCGASFSLAGFPVQEGGNCGTGK